MDIRGCVLRSTLPEYLTANRRFLKIFVTPVTVSVGPIDPRPLRMNSHAILTLFSKSLAMYATVISKA